MLCCVWQLVLSKRFTCQRHDMWSYEYHQTLLTLTWWNSLNCWSRTRALNCIGGPRHITSAIQLTYVYVWNSNLPCSINDITFQNNRLQYLSYGPIEYRVLTGLSYYTLSLDLTFFLFPTHQTCSQDLHKGVEIQAANGKKMLALIVFAHALRFFKDHCLQELSDQSSTRIVNDDIRWVITVPAIWRQPAKQFMRQAAYEVNLGRRKLP